MIKRMYPTLLSLAILSTLLIFPSFKSPVVPANPEYKKIVSRPALKAVPFRVINNAKNESVFVAWNLYAILRTQPSSSNGAGC
jgi:hypothetical protein